MEKQKYFTTSLSFGASSSTTTTTTTTTSPPNMDIQIGHELNCSSDQLPNNCFLNLNWENSMDQSVAFESALSSIVSSPVASNNSSVPPPLPGGESVVIRELIGRLGSICNSGEISPPQFGGGGGGASNSNYMNNNNNGNHSTNTSCYSTPLNSPPKLNLSMMDHHHHHHHNQNRGGNLQFQGNSIQTNHHHSTLTPFPTDPGFAERAARFSCFGGGQFGFNETELPYRSSPLVENEKLSRVSSSQSLKVNGSQMGGGGGGGQENKDYPLQDMLDTEMRSVSGSGGGKFSRFSRSSTPEHGEFNNAHEDSSLSEQIPVVETGLKVTNDVNARKRKATTRGKAKEPPSSKDTKAEVDDSNAKRSKSGDANGNEKDSAKAKTEQDTPKPPEPPKDYIHVRARRGQATDSHSLAERVRREKISERMKFLQDLVPGCNKVTGKAVMLDEIINYVQSLQRQVEFLSMKLATVNPRLDFNMEALLSKEILQSRGSFPHSMYPLESSASAFPYGHQPQQGPNIHNGLTNGTENPLEAALRRNLSMQLPSLDGFCDSASQLATFWEDDLQSVVQMGFGQNQPQTSHGMSTNHMKVEL